jgi:hypothetical protein
LDFGVIHTADFIVTLQAIIQGMYSTPIWVYLTHVGKRVKYEKWVALGCAD